MLAIYVSVQHVCYRVVLDALSPIGCQINRLAHSALSPHRLAIITKSLHHWANKNIFTLISPPALS